MTSRTPFSLRIFVADGDPDGLRLVERSNWNGKALVFPRALYPAIRNRAEFQQTGVYLLLGPRTDGDGEMIYIGEGDPVRPRLDEHHVKKDFWTRAAFFIAGSFLNKAHVQYLEAQLVRLAASARRMPLDNGNRPAEPSLSEADRADMDVFLGHILGMLPVLGIHAFEIVQSIKTGGPGLPLLTCQGRGAQAQGTDTPQGFVVKAGSSASSDEAPSLKVHFPSVSELRADLLRSGVVEVAGGVWRFTQDYSFSSPSMASTVILGRSSNGRTDWKDAGGRTLKELQEAQAQN